LLVVVVIDVVHVQVLDVLHDNFSISRLGPVVNQDAAITPEIKLDI